MPYQRAQLWTHVHTVEQAEAIMEYARGEMKGYYDTEVFESLAYLRYRIPFGPFNFKTCNVCGKKRDTHSHTCTECKKLLSKEVRLLHKIHRLPTSQQCQLCKKTSKRTLNLDHSHRSGKARGFLCTRCNAAVSLYDNAPMQFCDYVDWLRHKETTLSHE